MKPGSQYYGIFNRIPKIVYSTRNIRIQSRLIWLFLLLSLLPMLITSLFSFQQSSNAIQNKINTYSLQVVDQVARNIKVQMTMLENDTVDIGFSEIVQETLVDYKNLSEWETLNAQEMIQDMLVKKFTFLSDISDVLIFTENGDIINAFGNKGLKLNLKGSYQDSLIRAIKNKNGAPLWRTIGSSDVNHKVRRVIEFNNGLIVGKAIKSLYEGEYIGAVIIRINERFFSEIYRDIDIGQGSEIFVMDSRGIVVSSRTGKIPFQQKYRDGSLIIKLKDNERRGQNVFQMAVQNQPYMVAFSAMGNTGWYVVSAIPYSYLNLESGKIRNRIIILGISCFLLAVFLSVLFAKSISNPLNRLINVMNQVKRGDLRVHIEDDHKDEIAELTRNFNGMIREIQNLMNDIKNTEAQKRNAELKALQAQINPHFLSNVLNTAKLLASAQKADNVESLLTSLIQLLHVSMGKEAEFITVRKEIEYLKNYLNIQEFRFYDKFRVSWEIEEQILDHKLPKFLLQPILENAIIHGIGPKKGQGVVEIKGFSYGGKIFFTITDDGVGMTQGMVAGLFQGTTAVENHFCGIGVKNVQERIGLYFGNEYGLRIDSCPNQFTTVEIALPLIKGEGETGDAEDSDH